MTADGCLVAFHEVSQIHHAARCDPLDANEQGEQGPVERNPSLLDERLVAPRLVHRADDIAVPIRFVQIGSVSGSKIILPSAVLRSSAIELMGSGLGSIPLNRLVNTVGKFFKATAPGGFRIETKSVPLSEVEHAWPDDDSPSRKVPEDEISPSITMVSFEDVRLS